MQGSVPFHTSENSPGWQASKDDEMMSWLHCSSDLIPMEYVYTLLKHDIYA